jgi:Cyclin
MALIYIDRLIQRNGFLLTELNVHRVIVTAILLAAKFFDDAYYNNAYYAKVGGVMVSEMNGLEVDFLFRINFSLHVPPELFQQYRVELLSHCDVDSLPLPPAPAPPQYEYTMDQHMAAASTQQQDDLELHHYRQQQQHLQQQAAALCNGFPMNTAGQLMPPQITPSPSRGHHWLACS